MQGLTKGIENNLLAQISAKASPKVMTAIEKASAKTGVNFAYMVQQASAESSFNPDIKAKTSSATGLYQFIDSTWLGMVNSYGDKHGIDTDGMSRSEILAMRKDPEISSIMAAEFAGENQRFLSDNYDGDIGATELYFAHFMGAGGAAAFLNAKEANPLQEAAVLFPRAANANKNVFYDSATGRAKSMQEVYNFFDKKFQVKDAPLPSFAEEIQTAESDAKRNYGQIAEPSRIYTSMFTANNNKNNLLGGVKIPTSYQSLLQNPIDLMMMTQLDLSFANGNKSKSLL